MYTWFESSPQFTCLVCMIRVWWVSSHSRIREVSFTYQVEELCSLGLYVSLFLLSLLGYLRVIYRVFSIRRVSGILTDSTNTGPFSQLFYKSKKTPTMRSLVDFSSSRSKNVYYKIPTNASLVHICVWFLIFLCYE